MSNFEYIKNEWPELYGSLSLGEQYVYSDPASSFVKFRLYAERVVEIIYNKSGLPLPSNHNLNTLLNDFSFKRIVPTPVLNIFHSIRKLGNLGAHENQGDSELAIRF
ncbi:MAG: DUF4145 domain-containing protein [Leptospiraceae bacterium]|nr:DUF4145 domain-containing protein [Leptospiraceae bacterium]MCP5495483.1 DUF4145 domain-containing protein [Leptospiraceae bacterium]